ncbi:G/U mismatch-specific DNA glycosylase [Alicyclobacillus contaminans]|uniref:mismatch-specific DNA-glycosylase n=1 Tax=Alicyclobacillus contaminans TaxID=392016 RepID=UPI0003F9EE8A|nr:mismatch-specific DNA-glycosylase [Alicyclobacillus contaminans]GMA51231.1 G/U mismatch-specific DNA glycosylase [Alicyclobacillus contaminans]
MPITERLQRGLTVLFIGFNPSPASYQRGFNYAGRNNRFYRVLYGSGLTPRLYAPEESPQLLDEFGYGFTNLVDRPTRTAAEITSAEYAEGRARLLEKMRLYQPKFACYVGKGVYEHTAQPKRSVPWGIQEVGLIPGITDFVAPSTSGLVRMTLDEQIHIYRELAVAARAAVEAWMKRVCRR